VGRDTYLLLRAVPLVQDGARHLDFHLLQLTSASLVNTQSIQGFQIACAASRPLFCDVLTSTCFPYVILGLAFQEKVPVTLHLVAINFCMPQIYLPYFYPQLSRQNMPKS